MNENNIREPVRSESERNIGDSPTSTESSVVRFTKHILGMGESKEAWRSQSVFMFFSYVLFVYVGLAIPEDILVAYPSATDFSDFMASLVPQIDRVTALGLSPEENRVNYSILWAASPLFLLLSLRWQWQHVEAGFYKDKPMSITRFLGILLFCVWIAGFTLFLWSGVEPVSRDLILTRWIFEGKLLRSLWAPIMVIGFVIVTTFPIVLVKALLGRHLTVTW